jgi:hypothetical protein
VVLHLRATRIINALGPRGIRRSLPDPTENVTSRSQGDRIAVSTIDPATQLTIYDKNVLDKALYAHAMSRLLRLGREFRWHIHLSDDYTDT